MKMSSHLKYFNKPKMFQVISTLQFLAMTHQLIFASIARLFPELNSFNLLLIINN